MDIVDSIKSALERFAGIEIFHSLAVSMWNGLLLFSKVCFAAAAVLLVLYSTLPCRGRAADHSANIGSRLAPASS